MTNINTIELAGEITADTDLAILFTDGINEAWIARSLIEIETDFYKFGEPITVTMPEWVAKREGFI